MNTSERPSAQLESGLGLRPHEFESRILRQLTRGNAVWPRFVGRARLVLGPKLVSSGSRGRTRADAGGHQQTHVDGARAGLWTSLALCAIPNLVDRSRLGLSSPQRYRSALAARCPSAAPVERWSPSVQVRSRPGSGTDATCRTASPAGLTAAALDVCPSKPNPRQRQLVSRAVLPRPRDCGSGAGSSLPRPGIGGRSRTGRDSRPPGRCRRRCGWW